MVELERQKIAINEDVGMYTNPISEDRLYD